MVLAHLLHQQGIAATVLERHDRDYVEGRVRAGVLEQVTVDVLTKLGLDGRMRTLGLPHQGTGIISEDRLFRVDFAGLGSGAMVMVYGQQEVMKDMFDAAEARGLDLRFDAEKVMLHEVASDTPHVTYRKEGVEHQLFCDYIAGCDGYHGVSRASLPADKARVFERVYPFGWLGILADVPPAHHELIYANHTNGFALASMRSPSRSRYYLQCAADEKIENWPDERFWDELCLRLGPAAGCVTRGPAFEKSIAPLRSFVSEPMSYNRLFLAGDAAHIVPPTGAKGMNLAVSDVVILARALADQYGSGDGEGLATYSQRALARVWKAERFSWWFTGLTHRFPDTDDFTRRIQLAELAYLRSSPNYQKSFAENYVGLPLQ